jgi:hypothetical protein
MLIQDEAGVKAGQLGSSSDRGRKTLRPAVHRQVPDPDEIEADIWPQTRKITSRYVTGQVYSAGFAEPGSLLSAYLSGHGSVISGNALRDGLPPSG